MTNTILAIDLGKFNSVLCHFDTDTRQASDRTPDAELRMVDEGSPSLTRPARIAISRILNKIPRLI